ncbi:unnamed protein product, partial [Discosporangium mesarthrocarpum]
KAERKGEGGGEVDRVKNVVELATELTEMVNQMAFEKHDFYHWFSGLEVVALPATYDSAEHLSRAVSEAQAAAAGLILQENFCSAARYPGSVWQSDPKLKAYSDLMLGAPDEMVSAALAVHCMVEAVLIQYTGLPALPLDFSPPHCRREQRHQQQCGQGGGGTAPAFGCQVPQPGEALREGPADTTFVVHAGEEEGGMPRNVVLNHGDRIGGRVVRGSMERAAAGEGRVDPRELVKVERTYISRLQHPRLVGQGGLPLEPTQGEEERGTDRCELLSFTHIGPKDMDRTRKIWALERLVNSHHPPSPSQRWSFLSRRCWDVLPPHVVTQVFQAENASGPTYLRHYFSFKCRPAFKDWAAMAPKKDPSYTPRTVYAVGGVLDMAKKELARGKMVSVRIYPADHSLVVLSGFKETSARWLSVFKDGHLMGLRLREYDPPLGGNGRQKKGQGVQKGTFAAHFVMSFEDNSRLVVSEGHPPSSYDTPANNTNNPTSNNTGGEGSETRGSRSTQPSGEKHKQKHRVGEKPDGFGTMRATHTFPTGLVVTLSSDGTVRMEFVVDEARNAKGRCVKGFAPEAAKDELARCVVGRGTVVRSMRDGTTQMLFATGDVVIQKGDNMTLTDRWGQVFSKGKVAPTQPVHGRISMDPSMPPAVLGLDADDWVPIPLFQSKDQPSLQNPPASRAKAGAMGMGDHAMHSAVMDIESGAKVWSRPRWGGAVVVYPDGVMVTRHEDGTVQRWIPGEGNNIRGDPTAEGVRGQGRRRGGRVLVECPGFAAVEVDVEIQDVCSMHARGQKVAITKGGNRVRLRTALPNGGMSLVTYDTRITSRVCGRIIYLHPDHTEVIVSDEGDVIVRPNNLWEGSPCYGVLAGPNSSLPPNTAQPDLLVGTYSFDCRKGVMEVEDPDRNRFALDLTKRAFLADGYSISREGGSTPSWGGLCSSSNPGTTGPTDGIFISLAGESSELKQVDALVENPIEPRLFVYRRDGSALELLRKQDELLWRHRLQLLPSPPPKMQQPAMGRARNEHLMEREVVVVEEEDFGGDVEAAGVRQISFHTKVKAMPRGEGAFDAIVRGSRGGMMEGLKQEEWRTRPLPLCARSHLAMPSSKPRGQTLAMDAWVRRIWLEYPPVTKEDAEEVERALVAWTSWKRARAEQVLLLNDS